MARVVLRNVLKNYKKGVLKDTLRNINLDIEDGEFIVFVGPSGCGKSTLLRMVAGLEDITEGELLIDDKYMNDVPPVDRGVGMVFQSYALYPHMNVRQNMEFGLKLKKFDKDTIEKRVNKASQILGLEALMDRKPKALSGGQRQRVAIGRSIVQQPDVFLFDEPLSNLDAALRVKMRIEIAKLHKELNSTIIYVTHDQVEAMTLADRIVVLSPLKESAATNLEQFGSPLELYHNPQNKFVAGFIGSPQMNFINTKVSVKSDVAYLQFAGKEIALPADKSKKLIAGGYAGKEVIMGIRPEHVKEAGANAPFTVEANVNVFELLGAEVYLYVDIAGESVTVRESSSVKARVDDKLHLTFDVDKIHVFDKETEQVITN